MRVNRDADSDSDSITISQTSPPATMAPEADSGITASMTVQTGALAYKTGPLSTTAPTGAVSSQLLYSFAAWHPSRLRLRAGDPHNHPT